MAMENPWSELPERPPYVLPMDRAGVEAHERRLRGLGIAAQENFRLHTELLPTPFLGNPAAPVVLLNLNPGFSEQDEADYALPAFRSAATRNLTHEVVDTPFFTIDSSLPATSSYRWWRSRLRRPIEAAGESAERNLFCVQAFLTTRPASTHGCGIPRRGFTTCSRRSATPHDCCPKRWPAAR